MRIISVIICLVLAVSCKGRIDIKSSIISKQPYTAEEYIEAIPEANSVVPLIDPFKTLAARMAMSMDDHQLASQILISAVDGSASVPSNIRELLKKYPAGGINLYRYNLNTDNDSIRKFTSELAEIIFEESGINPFICVDHEGGTVNRFRAGLASLPDASYYWSMLNSNFMNGWDFREAWLSALEKIEEDSLRAGREISELGFNMNFAPVAEFLNEDNYDFLIYRSYSPDRIFASQAALAFLSGMREAGILCVVKHFPASAGTDPHYSLSVIDRDLSHLETLIYPFSEAVKNGARAVMAAHTLIPAADEKIASLSAVLLEDYLRGKLGFDGIIISDDFIMEAAGGLSPEEAAVLSVAAGADMILVWPSNLAATHSAFIVALEEGRLSRERLEEAATRILYEKLKMGLAE